MLLAFLLFNIVSGQKINVVIVGPQNACNTGVSNNSASYTKYFDIDGATKLKITTLQHRSFDNSKIYNATDGTLIWEWQGESSNETWYTREHFINVTAKRIRIEFKQGYSDPFCNGYIKIEKLDNKSSSNLIINNVNLSSTSAEVNYSQIKNSSSGTSTNPIIYNCSTCKEALRLYSLGAGKKINFPIYELSRMRALVSRCFFQYQRKGFVDECDISNEYQQIKSALLYSSNPKVNRPGEEWEFDLDMAAKFATYNLPVEKIIREFESVIESELVSCQDCLASLNDLYTSYSYLKENSRENRYNKNKIEPALKKFNSCLDQGVWLDMVERDKSKNCKVTKSIQEKFDELSNINPRDLRYKYFRPSRKAFNWPPRLLAYYKDSKKFNDFTFITSLRNDSVYKKGVFDENGYGLIKPRFDHLEPLYFGNDLYFKTIVDVRPLEFVANFGLVDKNDSTILTPEYEKIIVPNSRTSSLTDANMFGLSSNLNNNVIFCKKDGKWSVLSTLSNQLRLTTYVNIVFEYKKKLISDGITQLPDYCNRIKYFNIDGLYGFLNFSGEELTPPIFSEINENEVRYLFSERDIRVVKKGRKFGLLDENCTQILEPEYDEIGYPVQFSRKVIISDSIFPIKKYGKYGFISETGRVIVEPVCDTILNFNTISKSEFALFKVSGKFGLISRETGKFISEPVYDTIYPYPGNMNLCVAKKSDGIRLLRKNGSNINNKVYDKLEDFNWRGVAALKRSTYFDFLDSNGNTLSTIRADNVVLKSSGAFIFRSSGKYGLISPFGGEVIKPLYDSLVPSSSNLYFYFRFGELWGLIDNNFKIAIPPSFQSITETENDNKLFFVKKSGKYGLVNIQNRQIVACSCEVIETSVSTVFCLNGTRVKLFSLADGNYLQDLDRVLKNPLNKNNLFSNSYQEVICKLPIQLPVTTWTYVDNRSACDWCGINYKSYEILTEADIQKEKYYRCYLYFEEMLDKHFSNGYIDSEHKDHDYKRVKDLLVKNFGALSDFEEYFGLFVNGSLSISMSNYMAKAFGDIKNMYGIDFGGSKLYVDKSKLVGSVPRYSKTSDYCSKRCEYEYKRSKRN